ncbi:mitochondrial export translocase Oxa2 [Aspergillus sclerotioniger CBS 115572]|uniref:Mitochondrial export translocase Oxa2 n=1 Tax=Aspergillus sclerotioniger CBS 115572 TaxID=1450535 RepID=A0A317VSY4_9EURO|nr:mitochondrial export translocase Oxa2 [Aspergillus sclerotioniger CBS 115572]PWY76421.1 mitochondrial export translocase Oxa2 [Aspergillus sclerotioniger CBS 115572]
MRAFRLSHPARKTAAFQHVRHFHPTRPAPLINEALQLSSTYLHAVHDISHLPWALSIPLSALLVRTSVAMPLQIYTKVQALRERDAIPLTLAWHHHIKSRIFSDRDRTPPSPAQRQAVMREFLVKKRSVHRGLKIPRFWKPMNFVQLPIWISIMESLRAMSGNTGGLVPWLLSLIRPESADPATTLAIEPSLATEGALWFPDLLAGDPTGMLPLALSLSILLNVHLGWKTKPLKNMADLPKLEMYKQVTFRGLRIFVQVLALNVGLSSFVSEMPTALMIYWVTSTNIATMQTFILDRILVPAKPLPAWQQKYMMYKMPGKETLPPTKQ